MTEEKLPPLEIYIRIKWTDNKDNAIKQCEKVKNMLEKLADDFKLQFNREYVWGTTSKETYEKIFGAELAYDIDPDYSKTEKMWIQKKPALIPAGFDDIIQEIGLDYW